MNSRDWQKVKELFSATLDLAAEERTVFLEKIENSLRSEVEKLLANYKEAEDFIDKPAVIELGLNESNSKDSIIGKKIDDYLILEEIGSGGMGAVYLAEQQSESFFHRVALKLIKRGMDTNSVLKRFVMERQILANLEHQFIARFLDGGSTADGLPYFVMEYVEGLPIKKFCDTHNLDTKERLELFRKVCAAVSFAHQNLIVHRDLKPSNILVTEKGEPKLLDFGIAKLLHPDWSDDSTEATATMFRVMTPEYASPEQLRGLSVTTASDVYSLGVVLYELLTGERPFKIESRQPEEVIQILLTQEPVKPSALLSYRYELPDSKTTKKINSVGARQTADNEQTNRKPHNPNRKFLQGDLDNIILKALRKEPERRYQSVQEFSEDIRRHLAGLPVTATTDTFTYRAVKFVKRHKAGVFATALITLTILTATVITTWQSVQLRRERDKAERRFREVRKLANLVVFEYHDGIEKLAGSTAIREKMVKDALEYLDNLSAESITDADLQRELAAAYTKVGDVQGNPYLANLGDQDGALTSYQKASTIRERLAKQLPNDVQSQLDLELSYEKISDVLWAKGKNAESLEGYQKALQICKKLSAENSLNSAETYNFVRLYGRIGQAQQQKNEFESAAQSYVLAAEYAENLFKTEPSNIKYRRGLAISYLKVGDIRHLTKNYREAAENFQKAIEIFEEIYDSDKENAAIGREFSIFLSRIGAVQTELGEYEKALEANRRTIALQEKLAAADPNNLQIHFDNADVYLNLADNFERMKRFSEAGENYRRTISIFKQFIAKNPEYTQANSHLGQSYLMFAKFLLKRGNAEIALENFRNALEILEAEAVRNEIPDKLAETYEGIGDILVLNKGKNAEAEEMYRKSVEIRQKLNESNKSDTENAAKIEEILQKIGKLNS